MHTRNTHARVHADPHTCMQACRHADTHAHVRMHTHAHVHAGGGPIEIRFGNWLETVTNMLPRDCN